MSGSAKFVGESYFTHTKNNEPTNTHKLKPDKSTGEMLFSVGCRDDRPIVDSGMVVSTEEVNYSMNLESVLENHYNIMASSAAILSPTEQVAA